MRAVRAAETAVVAAVAEALSNADGEDRALERILDLSAGLLDGAVTAIALLDPDRGVLVAARRVASTACRSCRTSSPIEGRATPSRSSRADGEAASFPAVQVSPAAARAGIGAGIVLPLVVVRDGAGPHRRRAPRRARGRPRAVGDERRLAAGVAGVAAAVVERGLLAGRRPRARGVGASASPTSTRSRASRTAGRSTGSAELEVARAIGRGAARRRRRRRRRVPRRREAWGRAAGDAVLRRVAAAIGDGVRLVDTVGRRGEDEFVVLAPGVGGEAVGATDPRPSTASSRWTAGRCARRQASRTVPGDGDHARRARRGGGARGIGRRRGGAVAATATAVGDGPAG